VSHFEAAPGTPILWQGPRTPNSLATTRASELARAENARTFAPRQSDAGMREHFLRVASRRQLDSGYYAQSARRFEALAAKEPPKRCASEPTSHAQAFSLSSASLLEPNLGPESGTRPSVSNDGKS
jgi:hypothetical protein